MLFRSCHQCRTPATASTCFLFMLAVSLLGSGLQTTLLASARQQDSEIKPFKAPGSTLGKFTAELNGVVKLTPQAGVLVPEFATNGNSARTELQNASRKVPGAAGSSSSSSGGNSWSISIRGNELTVAAGFGQRHGSPYNEPVLISDPEAFYLQLNQSTAERPSVLVTAKEDKSFQAKVDDNFGGFTFEFEQTPDGQVRCIELSPDCQFAARASSFDELAEQHPSYVAKRLTPIFRYAGLGVPPTRYSPVVQKFVLDALRPDDPERARQFDELVKPMNSDQFQEREDATGKIEENFAEWETEIQTAISDPKFPAEVRARLKKIFDANVDHSARAFQSLASKGKLTENPRYLIWLLSKLTTNSDQETELAGDVDLVANQLAKLTQQNFGKDIDEWNGWLVEQEDSAAVTTESQALDRVDTQQLLATKGTLDDIADKTENLLRLKVNEQQLQVDRGYWKQKLGGKTVKEVSGEIRKLIADRNLPESWFQPGGSSYPDQTVEFPQVVFERITAGRKVDSAVAQRAAAYSRYQRNTGNREFIGTDLVGLLQVHKSDRRQIFFGAQQRKFEPIKQEYLQLRLKEPNDQQREIWFHDDRKGNLVASLRFSKLNSELRIIQRSKPDDDGNSFFLFDARGGKMNYFKSPGFNQFVAKHRDYWTTDVAPVFAKVGIVVGETQ